MYNIFTYIIILYMSYINISIIIRLILLEKRSCASVFHSTYNANMPPSRIFALHKEYLSNSLGFYTPLGLIKKNWYLIKLLNLRIAIQVVGMIWWTWNFTYRWARQDLFNAPPFQWLWSFRWGPHGCSSGKIVLEISNGAWPILSYLT